MTKMDEIRKSADQRIPLHQKRWFHITILVLAGISVVFAITGPIPKEWLASIPSGLSIAFQKTSAFLSAFGQYLVVIFVSLLIYWKRGLLLKLLQQTVDRLLAVYVGVFAFLLRPVVNHIQGSGILILSAKYGAQDKFNDVAEILR